MIRPGWNRRDLRGLQSQKIGRCEARIVCELQKQQSDEDEIEAALRDGGLDEERWRPSVALPNPNLTLVRPSTRQPFTVPIFSLKDIVLFGNESAPPPGSVQLQKSRTSQFDDFLFHDRSSKQLVLHSANALYTVFFFTAALEDSLAKVSLFIVSCHRPCYFIVGARRLMTSVPPTRFSNLSGTLTSFVFFLFRI